MFKFVFKFEKHSQMFGNTVGGREEATLFHLYLVDKARFLYRCNNRKQRLSRAFRK